MKYLAIINRKFYTHKDEKQKSHLLDYLKASFNADIKFSEFPGQIYKILNEHKNYDVIIAVGGDGTIHEIVNMIDLETQSIMIIPMGGGNTLARDLGLKIGRIPENKPGTPVNIDIIKCTFSSKEEQKTRYVISISGIGFYARSCLMANKKLNFLDVSRYFFAGLMHLFINKTFRAQISVDDGPKEKKSLNFFIINNTKNVACFLYFPDAAIDDGQFNGIITKTNSFKMFLFLIGTPFKHIFYRPFEYTVAKKLNLTFEKAGLLMIDGEIYTDVKDIEYLVCPKKLKIIL